MPSGDDAVASGNEVDLGAVVPVQVCGIGVGLLGDAATGCVLSGGEPAPPGDPGDPGDPTPGDPTGRPRST